MYTTFSILSEFDYMYFFSLTRMQISKYNYIKSLKWTLFVIDCSILYWIILNRFEFYSILQDFFLTILTCRNPYSTLHEEDIFLNLACLTHCNNIHFQSVFNVATNIITAGLLIPSESYRLSAEYSTQR